MANERNGKEREEWGRREDNMTKNRIIYWIQKWMSGERGIMAR
jgi:hypothetical protein